MLQKLVVVVILATAFFGAHMIASPAAHAAGSCDRVAQIGGAAISYYQGFTIYAAVQKLYDFNGTCALRHHGWVVTTASGLNGYINGIMYWNGGRNHVVTPAVSVPSYPATVHTYGNWIDGSFCATVYSTFIYPNGNQRGQASITQCG
jgi:hypothetical protein